MMLKYYLFLSIVGSTFALFGIGQKQSAGAQGQLFCDNAPAANVLVKLFDNNGMQLLLLFGFFSIFKCTFDHN